MASVGLALLATSAHALEKDFGDVGAAPGGTYFAEGFIEHTPGAFTDFLMFSLSSPAYDMWYGLGTISDQPKVDGSNIDGLTAALYIDNGVAGESADDSFYALIGSGDYVTGGGPLAEGAYYFKVQGTATGPSPSSYAYTATVAAVPEPQSYAMLLAGLGLMGLIVKRRSS
ncbi:FxDxF family PEP-CTERM protein [Nitrogeniibacter mangrovi]|nr:FxDxF family PEP-CTERM protein [Nitrogeniibacter mangrovi]